LDCQSEVSLCRALIALADVAVRAAEGDSLKLAGSIEISGSVLSLSPRVYHRFRWVGSRRL